MKRYLAFTFVLVLIDQFLAAWALRLYADHEIYSLGLGLVFRYGRWDHGVPIATFLPPQLAILIMMSVAWLSLQFGARDIKAARRLWLPMAVFIATPITQSLDMLLRGFAVNYAGFSAFVPYGFMWMLKLTDLTAYLSFCMAALFAFVGLIENLSHGPRLEMA